MALKLLDENGLLYVWGKIKSLISDSIGAITIGNGKITIQKEGVKVDDFTVNQSGDTDINIVETDPIFSASPAAGITENNKTAWSAKYDKPSGGIPSTDLSSAVQASLGLADSALQSFTETDPTVPSYVKSITGVASSITAGSTSTDIPTSAAVESRIASAISSAQVGAATFKGSVSAGSTISSLTAYTAGWYWLVDTAGTYVGQTCEVGDFIYCIRDYSSSYSASDFKVVQANVTAITNTEIDTICV